MRLLFVLVLALVSTFTPAFAEDPVEAIKKNPALVNDPAFMQSQTLEQILDYLTHQHAINGGYDRIAAMEPLSRMTNPEVLQRLLTFSGSFRRDIASEAWEVIAKVSRQPLVREHLFKSLRRGGQTGFWMAPEEAVNALASQFGDEGMAERILNDKEMDEGAREKVIAKIGVSDPKTDAPFAASLKARSQSADLPEAARLNALTAFTRSVPPATKNVLLKELVNSPSETVRRNAFKLLVGYGGLVYKPGLTEKDQQTLEHLSLGMKHQDPVIRSSATNDATILLAQDQYKKIPPAFADQIKATLEAHPDTKQKLVEKYPQLAKEVPDVARRVGLIGPASNPLAALATWCGWGSKPKP